jgi:hypothetical protein
VFAGVVLLTSVASAAPPGIDERAEARRHFESATRSYDSGRFEEAAAEFQTVFDLMGDPALLFDIAQSYRYAQKYEKALLFYRSYMRRAQSSMRAPEVEQRIAELQELLRKAAPPAETPTPPKATPTKSRETRTTEVEPPDRSVAPPAATTPSPSPRSRRVLGWAGVAAAGIGGVALIVGAAMAATAVSDSNQIAAAAAANPHGEFTPALRNTQSQGQIAQPIGIACLATGGVVAAAAAALLVMGYRHERSRVDVSFTGSRLVVTGAF